MKSMSVNCFQQKWSKIITACINSSGRHQHPQNVHSMHLSILFHDCLEIYRCVIHWSWNVVRIFLKVNACVMSNSVPFPSWKEMHAWVLLRIYCLALELYAFRDFWLENGQRLIYLTRKIACLTKPRHGYLVVFSFGQLLGIICF